MKVLGVLALTLLWTSLASGQRPGQWLADGKPTADSDWSKASNGFGAQLIVVGDPKAFLEMWNKPEQPDIKVADSVVRGQQFGGFILFAGCKAGSDGNCNTTVDFSILGPDGKVMARRLNQVVYSEAELDRKTTYLGKAILGMRLSDASSLGRYTIIATVSDKNAPATLELKTTVELKAK